MGVTGAESSGSTTVAGQNDGPTGGDPTSADGSGEISRGDIYELISNERRRHVLRILGEGDGEREVYLRELAERVAAYENDEPVESVTTQERRRTETALRQFHLPKMADRGFVEYDGRRKTATLAVPAETYADYLDPRSEPEGETLPWVPLLTGVGVVSIAVAAVPYLLPSGGTTVLAAYPLLLGAALLLLVAIGASRDLLPSSIRGRR